MNEQQVLVGLHGSLVLDHAVRWDTNTYQCRSQRTDATDDNSSFKARYDPCDQRPSYQDRPDARYGEHRRAKEQTPEPTPESSHLSRCYRKALHVDATLLEFLYCLLRLLMRVVYSDY